MKAFLKVKKTQVQKDFWDNVEKAALEVESWPAWKKKHSLLEYNYCAEQAVPCKSKKQVCCD